MSGGVPQAGMPGPADPLEAGWGLLLSRIPRELAADSGASLTPDGNVLRLKVVDRECDIDLSARKIRNVGGGEPDVGVYLQILILHYLAGAGNAPVADRLATFREFEGGGVYYPAFRSRVIDRLLRVFGAAPERLRDAGTSLGAEPVRSGDVGFRVPFFPKLPMVVVLWLGDEEVPPTANVLFDANAGRILPTEDLAIAAESLVRTLVAHR